jgi:hypothetical protein
MRKKALGIFLLSVVVGTVLFTLYSIDPWALYSVFMGLGLSACYFGGVYCLMDDKEEQNPKPIWRLL